MSTGQERIGAKPVGSAGIIAGTVMNWIHRRRYRSIIDDLANRTDAGAERILDIGCGGGVALKALSESFGRATIIGMDHSPEMVRLSLKTNKRGVLAGRIRVLLASVENTGIEAGSIDLATAFDTINFWTDHGAALAEIRRVLKPDGRLCIVNGYPAPGTAWYEFVKFKNEAEYRQVLEDHGFKLSGVSIEGGTIVILGESN